MSWNPLKAVGDFAYQNTGADNFMNIARGVRDGNMSFNPMDFGNKNSFWGNAAAGLGEAGLMFLPGGGALKAAKAARALQGVGRVKGIGTTAKTIGQVYNPVTYSRNLGPLLADRGVSGLVKTGVFRSALSPLFGGTPASASETVPTKYSSNRSSSPAGSYNRTGVAPGMGDTIQQGPTLGMNGVSGSYLTPQEASYYNSASGGANSAYKTDSNMIQSNLLDTIGSINRSTTGAGLDLQGMAADYGLAQSPQVDVSVDYVNQAGQGDIATARKKAAQDLAELQRQRAQAINQAALARFQAEQAAKFQTIQPMYYQGGNQ